nr:hypothetical protein [Escherichia coli]
MTASDKKVFWVKNHEPVFFLFLLNDPDNFVRIWWSMVAISTYSSSVTSPSFNRVNSSTASFSSAPGGSMEIGALTVVEEVGFF